MSGFKNAPTLDKFFVGMEFTLGARRFRVVHVDCDGNAWCVCGENVAIIIRYVSEIPDCTLDLDLIWVGREYETAKNPSFHATVLALSDTHVAFKSGMSWCWTRGQFLAHYRPVPLPAPDSEQVEPAWKPEPGKECLWEAEDGGPCERVNVIHVHKAEFDEHSDAWIDNDRLSRIVNTNTLRPIPPVEPPVKVGNIVMVQKPECDPLYGRISRIWQETHLFEFWSGPNGFTRNWDEVTITRLVEAK